MNLKPLSDRVLIKPMEAEETTKSGIVIPETARKERPQEGEVVAVGPGKIGKDGKTIPMSVKAGDKIIFSKYGGSEIKIDDQDYLIMREEDILAVVG